MCIFSNWFWYYLTHQCVKLLTQSLIWAKSASRNNRSINEWGEKQTVSPIIPDDIEYFSDQM